ncbi:DUF6115 domain-containing protein [Paenibacillus mendelii]|uniref:DUF6115 domain-containing protein n=1 Tax=Paenibacillus mendelii TaxID=206163 RepID=A0ABV6JGG1_9BACL|nr:hypothetical protein [Paenibacillus mendelii]MCQ6557890.1 hypothetical protein [Paenibacillus mendelii]
MDPWLYIVLLGAVVIVFGFIQPRKHAPAEGNLAVRNMETALETFMENMEADNRDMVNLVAKVQQEHKSQAMLREERIDQLEKRCAELEQSLLESNKQTPAARSDSFSSPEPLPIIAEAPEAVLEVQSDISVQDTPPTIRARYSELFELYDNGKSVEAIAKKLNLNKGEVQLILQLSKQEETNTR